ncbi:hypothetical protein PPL_08368 [Heterostelium album PN500]|uniref:MYND-type domain-containing protein n=1 Tax=Heterostelium pallidum (strain ATCC 26659 / Pp 5 / PN500) TaxID=670386 RepID=D3BI00_HETP5|nr:hypothetical protein PPL_08368 [Heterostelium album PN500]EFA78900.1 hypothetical protein PPL_08368 [Heterostelium album PN500]|eukprot:XP_020431024.1 hypothetical protein PPL_08368 [Heterostelium album PN500]
MPTQTTNQIMVVTIEQRYKHRYKFHHDFERILRVFRKVFYERWRKTHGKDYVENAEHGEMVRLGTSSFNKIMSVVSMKKLCSGRTVEWDYIIWYNVLSNYQWKNIPERQLIAQNEDITKLTNLMNRYFFWDDSKKKVKQRRCSLNLFHGCRSCPHEEDFKVWDYMTKVREHNTDVLVRIDRTMTNKDWSDVWRAFQQNDDNYQAAPLYNDDELNEMEPSMAYKKQADEQMTKGNFVLAIHLLTLALDYRGVTEHHLAGLFEQRATCYVLWMEKNKMAIKSFGKLAKRDIQRSLAIRPCHAASYSVLARCHDIINRLDKAAKAAYFHKTALLLDPKNQAFLDAKKRSEEMAKRYLPYAMPIHPLSIDPFVMSRGDLPTREHMDIFQSLTEVELASYYDVHKATEFDGSKARREHYDKSTEEFQQPSISKAKEAIDIYRKSIKERTIHAECYVRVACQYLDGTLRNEPGARDKAVELLKIAIQQTFVLSTGFKINNGVGEAYLLLGKLALGDKQSEQAIDYFHKAIENNDGCLTLSSAAFQLGTVYIKSGGDSNNIEVERGLAILKVAADNGSKEAAVSLRDYYLQTNGVDSPLTKYWTSWVKIPPRWNAEPPIVFPGSELQQPLSRPTDANDKKIISYFRSLLLKNAKSEVEIPKTAKMTFETKFPKPKFARFTVEDFKVSSKGSLDMGDVGPMAGLDFKALGMPKVYEKCYIVGTMREPALCKGTSVELLIQDVLNTAMRVEVRGYNPRVFKIGCKYAFFTITTCQSKFDGADLWYSEYIAVGGAPSSDSLCRACLKPCKSKCSKCPANYCDRDCQVLDWKDLDHKSLCGVSLPLQRIEENIAKEFENTLKIDDIPL